MNPDQRRAFVQDIVAHVIAGLVVLGFFGLSFIVFMGHVDLKDATVTTFLGVVLGYTVKLTESVLLRYFRSERDSTAGTSTPPAAPPPKD